MKAIEIDVTDIESRGIIAELPNNIALELIYNTINFRRLKSKDNRF